MSGPDWLNDIFAGVMVAVAVYSMARVVATRRWGRLTHVDVDIAHVLMGASMTAMLLTTGSPSGGGSWEVVFAALTGYFVWRCYRFITQHGVEGQDEDHVHHLSHYVTHVVMSGAMLYMYLAVVTPSARSSDVMAMGGATGTTADFVGIPLVFLCILFASGVWELDGIGRFSPALYDQASSEMMLTSAGPSDGQLATAVALGDPAATGNASSQGTWLAPRLEAGCHIAMCVATGYMLVLML